VQFVRINGNRVIRVEVAKIGKPVAIFTRDEVEGLMRTDGTPLEASNKDTRTVKLGDAERDPDKEAPVAPPSLRNPGEKLPGDDPKDNPAGRIGVMRPVQFPKSTQDDGAAPPADGSAPATPASTDGAPSKPAAPSSGNPAPPANTQTAPGDASQPAPAKPQGQATQTQQN